MPDSLGHHNLDSGPPPPHNDWVNLVAPTRGRWYHASMKTVPRRYVWPVDIARWCEVSRSTVQRWIIAGKLPAVKFPGGHCRVTVTNFKAFLERHGMEIPKELK